ncbi:hypothetical protein AGLY_014568 [Aphis glycines]|uniref:Uncharacterized protein n=1 Tax=Aphis glycines TaxID=307491 RepID=A0A6G0T4N3_APHGL|nr:hypothetical protein AGLY_014568 [Aphis glycines]
MTIGVFFAYVDLRRPFSSNTICSGGARISRQCTKATAFGSSRLRSPSNLNICKVLSLYSGSFFRGVLSFESVLLTLYAALFVEPCAHIRSGIFFNSHPTLGRRRASCTGVGAGLDGGDDKSMISEAGVNTNGATFLIAYWTSIWLNLSSNDLLLLLLLLLLMLLYLLLLHLLLSGLTIYITLSLQEHITNVSFELQIISQYRIIVLCNYTLISGCNRIATCCLWGGGIAGVTHCLLIVRSCVSITLAGQYSSKCKSGTYLQPSLRQYGTTDSELIRIKPHFSLRPGIILLISILKRNFKTCVFYLLTLNTFYIFTIFRAIAMISGSSHSFLTLIPLYECTLYDKNMPRLEPAALPLARLDIHIENIPQFAMQNHLRQGFNDHIVKITIEFSKNNEDCEIRITSMTKGYSTYKQKIFNFREPKRKLQSLSRNIF